LCFVLFFFSSRRRHTRSKRDWSSDVCSSDLRERPEDIPLLAKAFTFKIARRLGRNIDSIPAETLRTLSNMEWPGNVRELGNVIEIGRASCRERVEIGVGRGPQKINRERTSKQ